MLFFSLAGQINFNHFESVCEKEKGGNGGATFDVDSEVEGFKNMERAGVEKATVLVLTMVASMPTH
jgi:hypothetical protein